MRSISSSEVWFFFFFFFEIQSPEVWFFWDLTRKESRTDRPGHHPTPHKLFQSNIHHYPSSTQHTNPSSSSPHIIRHALHYVCNVRHFQHVQSERVQIVPSYNYRWLRLVLRSRWSATWTAVRVCSGCTEACGLCIGVMLVISFVWRVWRIGRLRIINRKRYLSLSLSLMLKVQFRPKKVMNIESWIGLTWVLRPYNKERLVRSISSSGVWFFFFFWDPNLKVFFFFFNFWVYVLVVLVQETLRSQFMWFLIFNSVFNFFI